MIPTFSKDWKAICSPRLGVAPLTRQAFCGADLWPLWNDLMARATNDAAGAGLGMDLAVIAQLRGDKQTGLAIQQDMLALRQLFRLEQEPRAPRLRVLAIAAASDLGANTPVEFLIEGAEVDLATWYVVPGAPLPQPMPAHDIAIVVAPATADGEAALAAAEALADAWPCPILNPPAGIRSLERDRLHHRLHKIPGLRIPATIRAGRGGLRAIAEGAAPLGNLLAGEAFPIIIRPLGSHAGFGLARIDDIGMLGDYLGARTEDEFFISPYIDYAGADGMFRKYRIVIVGGKPYPCHMAIADQWKVWYLNADMAVSVPHRIEEAMFMQFFDQEFGLRHAAALAAMTGRIGLDYFIVDCAETSDGALLIFEADSCAIVHDMDPPNVYPYKPEHMRRIFEAFVAMLRDRAGVSKSCAA